MVKKLRICLGNKFNFILFFLFSYFLAFSQVNPQDKSIRICFGTSPSSFGAPSTLQDAADVSSIIRVGDETSNNLLAAFQWFPGSSGNPSWDKIAVKSSSDGGITWSAPTTCVFSGMPVGYARPFDPCLMYLSTGQIRMYFTLTQVPFSTGSKDTWSAISNDGINYTVESGKRFDDLTKDAVDPSVALFGSTYYYNSWSGNASDGAHKATSTDGLNFTTQPSLPFDGIHLWLGNYYTDGTTLRFYGGGVPGNMWTSSTTNGTTWSAYTSIPSSGGADPSLTKNGSGNYILIYSEATALSTYDFSNGKSKIKMYPNPVTNNLTIETEEIGTLKLIDASGKCVKSIEINKLISTIETETLSKGFYFIELRTNKRTFKNKIIKY